ncbi:MAG: 30S ribosomal protein S20 [Candidatus Latescibacterota bacterium]|nr:MAG: 30S ribosomal protein S20 [Candidatus Latescibacterota bacterium]
MPHHKSPKKRIRADKKRNAANRADRATIRTMTRKARSTENPEQAETALKELFPRLDKAVKRNLMHKNTVARRKSRAQKRVNALKAAEKPGS